MRATKSWIVTVGEDGSIILPKDLITYMGWHEGDTLLLKAVNDGILIERVVRAKI